MIKEVVDFVHQFASPQGLEVLVDTVLTGWWVYVAASGIVWFENAILVGFIFPGDSLVFALGVLAASSKLSIFWVALSLTLASSIGGVVGYFLGYQTGTRIFSRPDSRLFKQEYVRHTQSFFEKYGGVTILIARFLPVVRSFAPFMAGVGRMPFKIFLTYNVVGSVLWACGLAFLGYFLGNLPWIQNNFSTAILLVIAVSFTPVVIEYIVHKRPGRAKHE
jgi:membrane-associated protein